jgi:iron complex transport system substrate-binding protein
MPHSLSWGFFIAGLRKWTRSSQMSSRAEGVKRSRWRRGARTLRHAATALALLAAAAFALPLRASPGLPHSSRSSDGPARLAVTDELGRTIEVPQPVLRIVSLAPSMTETVFALGAGDRLVGDTNSSDYPAAAQTIARVGSEQTPSIEAIVALHPDLVLAIRSLNFEATVDALTRLGLTVYVADPHTVQGVLDSTARLANVIGAGDSGQALVSELRTRLLALQQQLAREPVSRVFFVVWMSPLISIGENTFMADALRYAGATSVVGIREGWPHVSLEAVVRMHPDDLVFAGKHGDAGVPSPADLQSRPVWHDLDAVRAGRVIVVSEALNHPSPRIVDAIEELARDLHPDAFSEKTP